MDYTLNAEEGIPFDDKLKPNHRQNCKTIGQVDAKDARRTDPKFMRSVRSGTAAGMVMRERKVQWSSVGRGQEQGLGQGAEATRGRSISTSRVRRTHRQAGSIFSGWVESHSGCLYGPTTAITEIMLLQINAANN